MLKKNFFIVGPEFFFQIFGCEKLGFLTKHVETFLALSRLDTKKFSKTQIFKLSKMIIKCIKIIFRIQRSLLKSFLVFWGPISTKISFWKKNFPKFAQFCPKMTKSRIFQISIVVWGRKMADIRPKNISKVPACPKFLPKFFLSPKLKNWWKIPKQLPPKKKSTFFLGG